MTAPPLSPPAARALFEESICDLPTHEYLRNTKLVAGLDAVIRPRAAALEAELRAYLQKGAPSPGPGKALRIVLSNIALDNYAGSELWTADVAKYLHASGVPVIVHTPQPGALAEDLRRLGIMVTASVEEVAAFAPTLLQVNHFADAAPLLARLAGQVPVLNMVHGLLPRPGMPGDGSVDHYGAVSIHARAKIHMVTGMPWEGITQLPNFVDDRRFTAIGAPGGVRRAALFSSRTQVECRETLRAVLAELDITLDHIGYNGGTPTATPERVLPQYDIVFAVGRSAIEALASGTHVILWDYGITGPAVTEENFWSCVATNFDLASNTLPWRFILDAGAQNWVRSQVQQISAASRQRTRELTRAYLPLSAAGPRLLAFYGEMGA